MKIIDVHESGSSLDGQTIRLNLTKQNGSHEWLELDHTTVGKLMAALTFAAGIGKTFRKPVNDMLGNGLELSNLIDPEFFSMTSEPGLDFLVLRLALTPDTFLDFRIFLTQAGPMQAELDRVVLLARSSDKSSSVH